MDNESYEELTPLLRRLYLQQEESVRQMSILRMQKEEQEALLSHMREGLVVLDGHQRIVTMNGAAHFILSVPEPLPERATLLEVNRNVFCRSFCSNWRPRTPLTRPWMRRGGTIM